MEADAHTTDDFNWEAIETSYRETIAEANRLSAAEDPERTPFASRYKAIEILDKQQDALQQKLGSGYLSNEQSEMVKDWCGVIDTHVGVLHIETEDLPAGEKRLLRALERLPLRENQHCLELLQIYNQLGMVFCNRNDSERADELLKKAEQLYHKWKSSDEVKEKEHLVEIQFTLTLFYLAQLFRINDRLKESSKYLLLTVARQLKMNQYEPEEWSMNTLRPLKILTVIPLLRQRLILL
eukprot:TRINITY_DN6884_c0_g1_i1.p1 TRINITY_DN6884_c0_g1~~TRINITY_DN6884_c0_g1_i1.p1  ORF type:complete len:251 (-),score=29.93 TRINITY_DN6884_c0_g1_i1:49-765(-)